MEENPENSRKRIHEKLERLNGDLQNAKSRKPSRLPLKAQDMQRDLAQVTRLINEAFDDWEKREAALKPGLGERLRGLFGSIRAQDRPNGSQSSPPQAHNFHKFRCVDCSQLFDAYDPASSEVLTCPKCGSKDIHIFGLTHPCRAESPIHIHDCKEVAEIHQYHDDAVLKCYELDTTIDELRIRNSELEKSNQELNALLTLQNARLVPMDAIPEPTEATRLWRLATGKGDDVLPELGTLLNWLLEPVKKAVAEIREPSARDTRPKSFDNSNDVAPILAPEERPSEEATAQRFLTQIEARHLEPNKGCYEDGAEARIVHQATITECPPVSTYGAFAAASWRAGWHAADREMVKVVSETPSPASTESGPGKTLEMLKDIVSRGCVSCRKLIDPDDRAETPGGQPIHKKCLQAVRRGIESFGENPDEIMGTDVGGADVSEPAPLTVPPRQAIRVVKIPPPAKTQEGKL